MTTLAQIEELDEKIKAAKRDLATMQQARDALVMACYRHNIITIAEAAREIGGIPPTVSGASMTDSQRRTMRIYIDQVRRLIAAGRLTVVNDPREKNPRRRRKVLRSEIERLPKSGHK
jgi:hypothetical protein